jgi:Carboxypeptidase regulatory-like domain
MIRARTMPSALWLAMVAAGVAAQNTTATPQQNPASGAGYKIGGTVVNAITGAPLARANISLADTRNRARMVSVLSSDNGHFEFTELGEGKYSLQGSRGGYLTSSYEQHEQFSTAIVTGAAFATDNLVLRLMPMATILGHVLDEAGEPARDAQVRLFVEEHSTGTSRVSGTRGVSTDDRGYFDIGALSPGTYFLSVSAKSWYAVHPTTAQGASDPAQRVSPALDVAYATTYYGGSTEAESAAPIELKGGEHREIDVRLSPVPALHVLFRVPQGSGQEHGFTMPTLQQHTFDAVERVPMGQIRPVEPGVYELTGIPAGRYDVLTQGPGEPAQFSEMDLSHDGQDLTATQGEAQARLTLTVKMAGDEPAPKQYVVGLRDSHGRQVVMQQPDITGELTFEAVKPGKYTIVVFAPGKRYAVARTILLNGDSAGSELTLAPGASAQLTAELAGGEADIEGVVQKEGKPMSGAMVVLLPSNPEAHSELFRRDQSDFDGTFLLHGVIPGIYTLIAIEDGWGFDWLKPGALARYLQQGQSVTVSNKMQGDVRLPEPVVVQSK